MLTPVPTSTPAALTPAPPSALTPTQFQKQYGVSAQYARHRLAHPHAGDLPREIESPIAPDVVAAPPFVDEVPFTDEALDEVFLDESGDPEWMQDFNPGIGDAIARYRAMVDASGLHGDQPYIGGVL